MNIKNLQFFDKDGFNLNFDWNKRNKCWEGAIYLPKVSVGLYANTTIYVLEKINNKYYFPTGSSSDKITFTWDVLNKFVDEFFMFNFDEDYIISETSALTYTPNDGPECNTLIINRFDTYDIPLETSLTSKTLPIHIAFMANERYDATTYNRTLVMSYNGSTIAKITFYAETVEEDERLKIWNSNLGYKITPEDEMIFYKSDIKEYKPDYQLLNEKRKELMLEGHNIYPYIGSYRAIINAIKFFGYDNLGIIEYWRNVNTSDENFGKVYHTSRYSLTKKETLTVGAKTIVVPNKDYKKVNKIALVYSINTPTGEVDQWELPLMKEEFTYTIEEAMIKLIALRKKLNNEFMPGSSRIIDIIGEANYFGIQALRKIHSEYDMTISNNEFKSDFEIKPSKYVYLTDDRYFDKYIIEKKGYEGVQFGTINYKQYDVINDISSQTIDELGDESTWKYTNQAPSNLELCQLYENYYDEVFVNHTRYEDTEDIDDTNAPSSAKVVLDSTSFDGKTFGDSDICFGYGYQLNTSTQKLEPHVMVINDVNNDSKIILPDSGCSDSDPNTVYDTYTWSNTPINLTFENIDTYGHSQVTWTVKMSDNQFDEDYKNINVQKIYDKKSWTYTKTGTISKLNKLYVKLPYIGYYDVTLTIDDTYTKTKTKCIKVEPYNIDIRGFYYDARNLPEELKYDISEDDEMYDYILNKLEEMTGWATAERTGVMDDNKKDFSMVTYTSDGEFRTKGPYYTKKVQEEWYLADNVAYLISLLVPYVDYARYIHSGVDVKPYTWFILGYDYSNIVGMCNPVWTIINNTKPNTEDSEDSEDSNTLTYSGKYLTFLLKEEGDYTVKLSLEDSNGNKYEISRNIFVVSKTANHKIYQTFKNEYDYYIEQKQLAQARDLQSYSIDDYTYDSSEDDYEPIQVGNYTSDTNEITLTNDVYKGTYTLYYEDEDGNKLDNFGSIGTITEDD